MTLEKILKNTIYVGLFFPTLKVEGKLTNNVRDPHITLKFRPTEDEIKEILDSNYQGEEILFSGYEKGENNEGIRVTSLEEISRVNSLPNPHITLSWSNESTPVKTGELKMKEQVPDFYMEQCSETYNDECYGALTLYGKLGFFLKGGEVVLINDLTSEKEEIWCDAGYYTKQNKFGKEEYFFTEFYWDDEIIHPITKKEYEEAKSKYSK